MDLQVPIDLIDIPILIPNTSTQVDWLRSEEHLNPADYNGTCTYYFEVTAGGLSGVTYTLWDETNDEALTSITTDTVSVKRYRTTWFEPNTGDAALFLRSSASASTASVWNARIIVEQVGATKTRIPIQHFANQTQGTAITPNDATLTVYCSRTSSASWTTNTSRGAYWKYVAADWGTISDATFEVIGGATTGSTSADCALRYDGGASTLSTLSGFDESAGSVIRVRETGLTLTDGAIYSNANKSDGTRYMLSQKIRLYLTLDPLTKAEVYWKLGGDYTETTSDPLAYYYDRFMLDLSKYSGSPAVYLETGAYCNESYNYHLGINDLGESTTSMSVSMVTGSGINLNSASVKTWVRSGDCSANIVDYHDFCRYIDRNAVDIVWTGGAVVVTAQDVADFAGMTVTRKLMG